VALSAAPTTAQVDTPGEGNLHCDFTGKNADSPGLRFKAIKIEV
jgi:hypothetical protein